MQTLQRVANDYYPTPDPVTQALLDLVDITGTVIEPCAGHGAISKFFPGCITNDLYPSGDFEPTYRMDATQPGLYQQQPFDWCVTNPPYGMELPVKILQMSFDHVQVGCAFLLRLSFLEPCNDRASWLIANADHLRHVIPVNPRPRFRRDTKGGDNVTVAWFVWRKDFSWKQLGPDCPFNFITRQTA